jgi:salicylate hydroxylase
VVNGPGTGEFIGFHVGSGEKKTFIWATTYSSSDPPPKREEWNQGSSQELEYILAKYPHSHPIHDFAKMTAEEDLLHFGLFYRHHKGTWTNGRVTLLGDSCHATLPYVGQGANQAIEDAIVLADCLARHEDYTGAYKDFYDRRFPRTKRIVQFSGLMHKLYHSENWFMQTALDFLLASMVKGGAIFKQLEKEIIDECPVKDYKRYAPTEK